MRFLYWPNAKIEREELIKRQLCWLILLPAPDAGAPGGPKGPYQWVCIWVDKKGSAIMKMAAYDKDNKKVKEYAVTKGQKVDGNWILERMEVSSYLPGDKRRSGLSFLHLDKPLRKGGR